MLHINNFCVYKRKNDCMPILHISMQGMNVIEKPCQVRVCNFGGRRPINGSPAHVIRFRPLTIVSLALVTPFEFRFRYVMYGFTFSTHAFVKNCVAFEFYLRTVNLTTIWVTENVLLLFSYSYSRYEPNQCTIIVVVPLPAVALIPQPPPEWPAPPP